MERKNRHFLGEGARERTSLRTKKFAPLIVLLLCQDLSFFQMQFLKHSIDQCPYWIHNDHVDSERPRDILDNEYSELITNGRHISSYWYSCRCHLRYHAFFYLQSLCTGQMKFYHHGTKHHTSASRYGT
jgi:hypothetical protein